MTAAISTRVKTLAVLLTAAVLALALACSPQAGARARGAACTHSAPGHSQPRAHPCAGSGSTSKPRHRRGKSHAHAKTGRHHARHPGKRPAAEGGESGEEAGETGAGGATGAGGQQSSTGSSETLCEDGSAPKAEGGGVSPCEEEASEAA